jgi:hypothetical protein
MKLSHKILRILATGTIFAMCSVAAFADSSHDPRVIIKGAGFSSHQGEGEGLNFQFSLPTNQGPYFTGDLSFSNGTSKTWTTLALFESTVAAANVSCGANSFFNHCMVFIDAKNPSLTEILFSNTVGFGKLGTGILPGEIFALGFSKGSGPHSWPSGTNFTAVATAAVPEPSTIAFLFTGIGAIASRRKLWKRAS